MTKRNYDQPNGGQPQSSHGSPQDEDPSNTEGTGSTGRDPWHHDRASVADDRGVGGDRDRRSFSGDREYDELGSEMEDDLGYEDADDELGG